ncbi:MAG: TrmH family RNA methyltransferase [Planctomycetes bacterium]|nr:TrmH family RNA methyltransferase [Planctomycetota bacterium]
MSGTLVLDGVENPGNVQALAEVARLFGWSCVLHDRAGLGDVLPRVSADDLAAFEPLVALENAPGADAVHGFRMPPGARPALVVGNERRGVGRDVLALARRVVQIPLASRRLDTLNVAAAAAVALHALTRGGGGKLRTRADPERRRPALLMLGPQDPIELGSALRSAAAFGWSSVLLDDRHGAWFEGDRASRSLGRGAARRGRNTIRVVPAGGRLEHDEAVVVTAGPGDEALHRLDLARGPGQLLVVPDEDLPDDVLRRLAPRVRVAGLDLPAVGGVRYRVLASIALAEAARQVGLRAPRRGPGRQRPPSYGCALDAPAAAPDGVLVALCELPP